MPVVTLIVLAAASALSTAGEGSPYAGQEHREIKALSTTEIEQYENGDGMGLARAAELNHYPGPKHVLQLASKLGLTEEQRSQTQSVYDAMHARAMALGQQLIAAEAELDRAFSRQTVTADKLNAALAQIGHIKTQIRFTHLEAHLKQRRILLPEQIAKYDKLRGYDSGNVDHSTHH